MISCSADAIFADDMNGKKVHIKSFGCQMNKLDTALVTTSLKRAGFEITASVRDADAVVINTCSVREHAEQRVFSHLGHLKHLARSRPRPVVAVIGCMAQRLGAALLEHQAVDIVCGPAQIPKLTWMITEAIGQRKKTLAVSEHIRARDTDHQDQRLEHFESSCAATDDRLAGQAFVRVMRGCDKFCTYCVVPSVRGPEVSRPPAAIVEQIKKLVDKGVKQVTLLGQSVNSYRYVVGEKTYCLADLLEMASQIDGLEWIKFVTNYPSRRFFDEILSAVADLDKVCEYLHIPAQSGSDKILRAMNRRYTAAEYLDLLARARGVVPGIAISGDFIVGFPGETDSDFRQTAELLEKAQYKNCFVFKYSPRPGTAAAAKLQDTVSSEIKRKRNIELLARQEEISDRLAGRFLGKTVTVLVEGPSKKPHLDSAEGGDQPQLVGRTRTDHIVVFNGPALLAGRFVKVKITKTAPLTLFGRLCRNIKENAEP